LKPDDYMTTREWKNNKEIHTVGQALLECTVRVHKKLLAFFFHDGNDDFLKGMLKRVIDSFSEGMNQGFR